MGRPVALVRSRLPPMLFDTVRDAAASFREIATPPFRSVLLAVLAITLAGLVLVSAGVHTLLGMAWQPTAPWIGLAISIVEALGLALAAVFLVAPVSALVAGFFVDGLADKVERDLDPGARIGRALPLGRAVLLSLRFAILSLLVTVAALGLLLVPGVNGLAFLLANTYLAGRQYFDFAALRYRSEAETAALRRANATPIYAAGFCIALVLAVPVLNLTTPLFATALMVRVHRRLSLRSLTAFR